MTSSNRRIQARLGRTGLTCSIAGLGCGGMNRLGLRKGGSMRAAADVVRRALDMGVTYFDTARRYGTEPAIGAALKDRSDDVVVSTKVDPFTPDGLVDPGYIASQVDDSLQTLGLDTIDIMQLHCVEPRDYGRVVDGCLEPLQRAQEAGKIRFLGISEYWGRDLGHETLQMALDDNYFDVMLVGCNMLNPSAARTVFPKAAELDVGIVLMFAVRKALADPALLTEICRRLIAGNRMSADGIDLDDPLGFIIDEGAAATLAEAAYRYCRHLAGVDVVLTGTISEAHLRDNIAAIEGPRLPPRIVQRIDRLFAQADNITGED